MTGLVVIFISGFIFLIIAILSVFGVIFNRSPKSTDALKKEMNNLEERVNELEKDKKDM